MSHVATVDLHIKDLDALDDACTRIGLELVRGQETYRWFGESVGDYPIPAGFTKDDLGKCTHAIRIPNNSQAYEIGVVARRDGKHGYCLMWDFWAHGIGMEDVAGKDCCHIKQEYARAVAIRHAQRNGFRVQEKKLQDGSMQLLLSK